MLRNEHVRRVTVLGALSSAVDRQALGRILDHTRWALLFAEDLQQLRGFLKTENEAVIVTDSQLADGTEWKDILREVEKSGARVQVIVAERDADDSLWADVLNLGAFDLLAKPFRSDEVYCVISSAWRSLPTTIQSFDTQGSVRRAVSCGR